MAKTSIVPLHIRAFPYYNSWQGDILGVAVQHLNPMIIKVELLLDSTPQLTQFDSTRCNRSGLFAPHTSIHSGYSPITDNSKS